MKMIHYKIKNRSLIEKIDIFPNLYKLLGIKLFERTDKNIRQPNMFTKIIAFSIFINSIIHPILMFIKINTLKFSLYIGILYLLQITTTLIISISIIFANLLGPKSVIEIIQNFDNIEIFCGKNKINKFMKRLYTILMISLIAFHLKFVFDIKFLLYYKFWHQIENFLIDVIRFQTNVWITIVTLYLSEVNNILKRYNDEFKTVNKNESWKILRSVRKAQIHLTRNIEIISTIFWVSVNILNVILKK